MQYATFKFPRRVLLEVRTSCHPRAGKVQSTASDWQVALKARCVAHHGHQGTHARSFSHFSTFQAATKRT